jgi:hypothetical protein
VAGDNRQGQPKTISKVSGELFGKWTILDLLKTRKNYFLNENANDS